MTSASDGDPCAEEQRFDDLPPRERIAFDEHRRVAHAIGTALPAWLVLAPRRPVTTDGWSDGSSDGWSDGWSDALQRPCKMTMGATAGVVDVTEADPQPFPLEGPPSQRTWGACGSTTRDLNREGLASEPWR